MGKCVAIYNRIASRRRLDSQRDALACLRKQRSTLQSDAIATWWKFFFEARFFRDTENANGENHQSRTREKGKQLE